ncbi:MAG: hypothetical protein ABIJ12_04060 [bacterium]
MRIYLSLVSCLVMFLLVVSGANAASATLRWTATGDDGYSGQATVYDIRYSLSTITEANWANATKVTGLPVPKMSGSEETFTVADLSSSTTYYFAIKAADEVFNWSVISNVVSLATLCCSGDGIRGNVDDIVGSGVHIDVADLVFLVDYMFKGGAEPPCLDEGNVDGLDGLSGSIDIADLTYLVSYLFKAGPAPAACP